MTSTPSLTSNQPARISENEEPKARDVDTGWAWFVCLSAHMCEMLTFGYFSSLGVLYIEWKAYFESSATASSWLISMPFAVACPTSPIIGVLAPRLGVRRVALVGSLLNGMATVLGSRATDLWQLYVTSGMSGLGMGMVIPSLWIMVARYFRKRFALASMLTIVGVNVGQMIFPPLTRLLVTHYGWRGTMLIFGAIQMNLAVASALVRPQKRQVSKHRFLQQNPSDRVQHIEAVKESGSSSSRPRNEEVANDHFLNRILSGVQQTEGTKDSKGQQVLQNQPRKNYRKVVLEYLAFLGIFGNVSFGLLQLGFFMYALAWITNLAHLPARSKEAGWSEDQGAALITIIAVSSLITRIFQGWVVDRGYISPFKLLLGAVSGATMFTFLNPALDNYTLLVMDTVFLGACLGVAAPLIIVIVKTVVSDCEVPVAMSWCVATPSFASAIGSVVAGKLFDLTGNYVATFLLAGGMFLASFLLIIAVFVLKTQRERERELESSTPPIQVGTTGWVAPTV